MRKGVLVCGLLLHVGGVLTLQVLEVILVYSIFLY